MTNTKKYLNNVYFSFLLNFFVLLIGFFLRRQFVLILGVELTGLNSFFNSIVSIFSLSELGIASAVAYLMYKPFKDSDLLKLQKLFYFFKKAYFFISLLILFIGFTFFPFLNLLIDTSIESSRISLYYALIVINTSTSYLLGYYKTVLVADQNSSYYSKIHIFIFLIQSILQILILYFLESYLIYLISYIFFTLLLNLSLRLTVLKLYPFLKNISSFKFSNEESKEIKKSVISMALHKLGSVVVTSTDSILISYFIGLLTVGLYSNYLLLLETTKRFFFLLLDNLTPSIGNFVNNNDKGVSLKVFYEITLFNFLLNFFASFSLFSFTGIFISVWLGDIFLLPNETLIYLCILFFLNFSRRANIVFIDATGVFKNLRFKSLIEGLVNIITSLVFIQVFQFGLNGVILGTLVSTVVSNIYFEPTFLFKKFFKKPSFDYFKNFTFNILITFSSAIVLLLINSFNLVSNFLINSLFSYFIVVSFSFIAIYLFYHKKTEFNDLIRRFTHAKKTIKN